MKIAIGCDHIVTDIKMRISEFLKEQGHEVVDVGTYDMERTHYPIFGRRVGVLVAKGEVDRGVVLCGTGVGISTSCDKVPGARCALVRDALTAVKAVEEMNANVIGFGGKIVGVDAAKTIVSAFLGAEYKPTEESKKILKDLEELEGSLKAIDNEHIFDEENAKWARGEYHD